MEPEVFLFFFGKDGTFQKYFCPAKENSSKAGTFAL